MRWERTHWTEVDDREIRSTVYRRVENAFYVQTTAKGEDDTKRWAPTKRKIADLMEATGAIVHLSATLDPPVWLTPSPPVPPGPIVACTNGLLHVDSRELHPLDPRFFNLVSVPFDADADATEPKRWLEFLGSIWPDDPDVIDALQEFFGYVLSGRTDLHKMLLVVGPTRSGKGTIARILTAMIGKANVAGPTLASLCTPFGLAPVLGKPLAIISDARLNGRDTQQVVERLLTISGEDTIDVDRKYRDQWTGRLPTRFLILSNELPNFADAAGAIAHRFIVLTMQTSWLGRENTALINELTAELPGILNWALDGLARLVERGRFTEPASSVEAVTAMKDTASPMSAFVRECCHTGPGHEVPVDDLYAAWKVWCEENGKEKPGSKQMLGRNLRAVVPQARVTRPREGERQIRVYAGVALTRKNDGHNSAGRDSTRLSDAATGPDGPVSRSESRPIPLWGPPTCTWCGHPLDPSLAEAGRHPTCGPEGEAP